MKNKTIKTPTSGDVSTPLTRSGYSKSKVSRQNKQAVSYKAENNKEKVRGSASRKIGKVG